MSLLVDVSRGFEWRRRCLVSCQPKGPAVWGFVMAVVSVFVSSTFRDFHAERDVLIESVRKRLDERLQPLGCRVEIVDLRWGVAVGDPDDGAYHHRHAAADAQARHA